MFLRSLELESIRSYRSATISFPKGRTLLSGDIGAGKSTILLAIEFALFGLVRGWNDGEKLLRHGATSGRVRLDADIAGPLVIERSLKRTGTGIQQEDVLIIEGGLERRITPSEARSLIIERLGYPPEFATKQPVLFRYTVFTPQESMKAIIDERADVRLDAIRKIFGIDRYERIASNAQIVARTIKQQSVRLSGRLDRKGSVIEEMARLRSEREQLEHALTKAARADERSRAQLEASREALDLARSALESERVKRETITRLHEENAELEAELEALIAERAELPTAEHHEEPPDTDTLEAELTRVDERLHELDEELEQVRQEHTSRTKLDVELNARLEKTQETIRDVESSQRTRKEALEALAERSARFERFDAKAVAATIDGYDATVDELIEERARIAERVRNAREQIASMPEEGECPVCAQPIDHEHRQSAIRMLEEKIAAEETRLENAQTRLAQIKEQRGELEQRLEAHRALRAEHEAVPDDRSEQLGSLRETSEKLEKNRAELDKRLRDLHDQLETRARERTELVEARAGIAKRLKAAHAMRMRVEKEKRAIERRRAIGERTAVIREKLTRIAERMPTIDKTVEERFERARQDTEQAIEAANAAARELERLRERARSLEEREIALRRELDELRSIEQQRARFDAIAAFLQGPLPDLSRQIETEVMRRILIETNDRFSKWFSVLVDDLDGYLDESFSPMIVQHGYDVSFDNLSGGERTSVALAFRLALHESINHLTGQSSTGLLILDEPTEGFSSEQLDSVREVLGQLNSEQIIIVSHEQKVEGFVDQTILIDKSGYESTIP